MTTWELMRTMAKRGYRLEMGPHVGFRGYWATFYLRDVATPSCSKCDAAMTRPRFWEDVGHGKTLHRAVVMAAKIALDFPVTIPSEEEFRL